MGGGGGVNRYDQRGAVICMYIVSDVPLLDTVVDGVNPGWQTTAYSSILQTIQQSETMKMNSPRFR